jgi:uncharacterized protein (DUF488 family)
LTIGVFGRDEGGFFSALEDAGVDAFIDIRQRRGVRGSQYAFVNSNRLQTRLLEMGVPYVHLKDLAPTTAVRDAQKQADARVGVAKRERRSLGSAFIDAYETEILGPLDPQAILDQFPEGCSRPVLFCVEGMPEACHRSLTAEWLRNATGLPVSEIR